jgi:peptidoglycan/LPS O-acetylase OafA/YrhL
MTQGPTTSTGSNRPTRTGRGRVRAAVLAAWAATTGAAPHVLHHVGPLAGTAVVAGAGGRLLFGLLGFVATIPLLRRLRRRTGGWRAPALALTAFVGVFTLSTLFLGPALREATVPAEVSEPTDEVDHHGHDPEQG